MADQNADYVSPEEAVEIVRSQASDGDHPVWGLLSLEMKRDYEHLEKAGLRIVRAQIDSSESA